MIKNDPVGGNLSADNAIADPPMLIRSEASGGFIRANASFRARVGFSEAELADESFLHWIEPVDIEVAKATLAGDLASCRIGHRTREGDPLTLVVRVVERDGDTVLLARSLDAEEAEETKVPKGLDDIEDEATVSGTLHTIARIVEDQNPGFKCSILLVADGRFVRGAGPSLPENYNAAIDGFAIGPTVGSCGTAIYWNVPVIVEDIQADPLWAPFAELAKEAGVAACWSHPFASRTGDVLGALALYSPVPRAPDAELLGRLKAVARLTGLAVERGRAEEALRAKRRRELELEEQLRQAAKMEALGVLAGGVAHDFNNILSTVLANAELGCTLLPENSELREVLDNIMEASKRAGRLSQQMLAYAGRGSLKNTRFEIGGLVQELGNLVQAAISKKTSIEYALLDQPIFVEGDENQLLQVIMNLVTNAAEAIGENEGRIVVKSELTRYDDNELNYLNPQSDLAPGEYVRLIVSDDGPGMDARTVERIFDPFFTTKITGHGLGLSAVKGIINKHGGAIQIDSKVGRGTIFTVAIPTVQQARVAEQVAAPSIPAVGHKRILIAEDEAPLRDVFSRRLRHAGFEVLEAADGQEAVDLFTEHRETIDCVLLDFSMPKLTGEEVQQTMHALREDLPIVMMSGFSEHEVVERFRDAGITACLQKPISADELLEAISNAIVGSS